jgi:FAD/FMN-containing dehydrogenase
MFPFGDTVPPTSEYERVRDALARGIREAAAAGHPVALKKHTSNLFRSRQQGSRHRIDVRRLSHVLAIDRERRVASVEGMTTYATLVDKSLRCGLLPAVTPELKTITVGGAVSGLGIESSSFRFGLVHETVEEMEVALGDGSVATCSRSVNPDLFFCLPNSYGTLGYILRADVRLVPAKRFVRLCHSAFSDAAEFLQALSTASAAPEIDFLDGTVFGWNEMYLTTGRMTDQAPWTSDYTWLRAYYKSIRRKPMDYLTTRDYIWRWDTDWFWCSKQMHVQHPAIRLILSPWLLNSATYQRVMRLSNHLVPAGSGTESVIQDIAIPVANAAEFLRFLLSEIPIRPVWICPFRVTTQKGSYPLYPMTPGLYINFGFWDVIPAGPEPAWYNRKVERATQSMEGRKALYSSSYYDPDTFRSLYDHERYQALKQRCDPGGLFGDLYSKCVQGA